jgi:hypothetical protein
MCSWWSRFCCWTCLDGSAVRLTTDDVHTLNHHFTELFRTAISHGERLEALEARLRPGLVPATAAQPTVGLGAAHGGQTARQGTAPPEYEQFRAVLDRRDALDAHQPPCRPCRADGSGRA